MSKSKPGRLDRYYEAVDLASSVEPSPGVIAVERESDEGHSITAHGRRYRFPTTRDARHVAALLSAIVEVGPLLEFAVGQPKTPPPAPKKRRRKR
jgi:hypothetical protein